MKNTERTTQRFQSCQSGYTLIELLVVISIFAVILIAGVGSFFAVLLTNERITYGSYVKQQGDFAIAQISTVIRNGLSVTPCSSTSLTVNNRDGTQTVFSVSADNTLQSTTAGTTVGLTGTNIQVENSNVFSCREDQFGQSTSVQIEIDLTYVNTSGKQQFNNITETFRAQVGLRRY